jgi:hypothetical protein
MSAAHLIGPSQRPAIRSAGPCVTCHVREGRHRNTRLRAVVCGPCWSAHGGRPDAWEMGPAPLVTAPLHNPTGQRHWLGALKRAGWVQDVRVDGRQNLLQLARQLALAADWDTLETMPGWDLLQEATGLSETTIQRWLQELRVRGWLVVIETGSTPATRPMVMATKDGFHINAGDGNRRAVYALRIPLSPAEAAVWVAQHIVDQALVEVEQEAAVQRPAPASPVEEKGRPSGSFPKEKSQKVGSFAREAGAVDGLGRLAPVGRWEKSEASALRAPGLDEEQREIWRSRVPTSPFEMLIAAAWLRRHVGIFGRLTRRGIRTLCRPLWAAGWSNLDVVHALDHQPGVFGPRAGVPVGRSLPANADGRDVWRWLQARLRAWVDADGRVLQGFYQAEARRVAARRHVAERHGRAGANVLGDCDLVLTAERVAAFGRKVARTMRPAERPRPTTTPESTAAARAATRAALDQALAEREAVRVFEERQAREAAARRHAVVDALRPQLDRARAELAARTAANPDVDRIDLAEWEALSPEDRRQRIRDRAAADQRDLWRRS